ncbi:MAG TPA: hypothetical protein VER98_04325 [Terriglobia bacterium]|nr:hypothetical protein [Terriglobia bacterium]
MKLKTLTYALLIFFVAAISVLRSVEAHRTELHTGKVIDAGDSTVLPGLIETHAHLNEGYGEILRRIFLAYGITTVRNPACTPGSLKRECPGVLFVAWCAAVPGGKLKTGTACRLRFDEDPGHP